MLLLGLAAGLFVSIFQAATQINDFGAGVYSENSADRGRAALVRALYDEPHRQFYDLGFSQIANLRP